MTCLFQKYPEVFVDEVFFHISIKKTQTYNIPYPVISLIVDINKEIHYQISQEEN